MMKQNGQNTQVETDTLVEEVVMQAETPEADIAIVFEEESPRGPVKRVELKAR